MHSFDGSSLDRGVGKIGVIGEELLAHHREIAVVAQLLHDLVEVLLGDMAGTDTFALTWNLVTGVERRDGQRQARAVFHAQAHGLARRIELDDLAHARRRIDERVLLGRTALEVLVCLVLVAQAAHEPAA